MSNRKGDVNMRRKSPEEDVKETNSRNMRRCRISDKDVMASKLILGKPASRGRAAHAPKKCTLSASKQIKKILTSQNYKLETRISGKRKSQVKSIDTQGQCS